MLREIQSRQFWDCPLRVFVPDAPVCLWRVESTGAFFLMASQIRFSNDYGKSFILCEFDCCVNITKDILVTRQTVEGFEVTQ